MKRIFMAAMLVAASMMLVNAQTVVRVLIRQR